MYSGKTGNGRNHSQNISPQLETDLQNKKVRLASLGEEADDVVRPINDLEDRR